MKYGTVSMAALAAAADADSAAAKYNYRMTDNFLELGNDNNTSDITEMRSSASKANRGSQYI